MQRAIRYELFDADPCRGDLGHDQDDAEPDGLDRCDAEDEEPFSDDPDRDASSSGAAGTDAISAGASGQVHLWSARWCALLERILAGRAAADIAVTSGRRPLAVVVLPAFTLVDPLLELGRKGNARDGTRLRFPARVTWSLAGVEQAVVILAEGAEVSAAWRASGVGVCASGSTIISTSPLATHASNASGQASDAGPVPTVLQAPVLPRRRVLAELTRLAADGQLALWEARQVLERHAEWMLRRRLAAVTAEIAPGEGARLLDETDLDVVRSELLLGDPDRRVSPAYDRIIERCLDPAAFARVDPERRVMQSLRSTTETALRRRIGDPHVGRKVRRLMSEESLESLDALLARYGERWPSDRVGVRRIAAALSVVHSLAPTPAGDFDAAPWVGRAARSRSTAAVIE